MRLATTLNALLAVTVLGCGSTADLVYVMEVIPFAGVTGELTTDVDTTSGVCSNNTGSICEAEPVGDHFARIRVVNEFTPDIDNAAFGRRVINRFQLEYISIGGGPQLPAISAATRVVLDAGSETFLTLILADESVRNAIGTVPAELYEVKYTLSGPDGLDITGATVVSIGHFNSCEEGLVDSPNGSC